MRRPLALASFTTAAALVLVPLATAPASAATRSSHGKAHGKSHRAHGNGHARGHEKSHRPKKEHAVPFAGQGTVTASDPAAHTLSVAVAHGSKALRGTTIDLVVTTSTRILGDAGREDQSHLLVGDSVVVLGSTKAGVRTLRAVVDLTEDPAPSTDPAPGSDDSGSSTDDPQGAGTDV